MKKIKDNEEKRNAQNKGTHSLTYNGIRDLFKKIDKIKETLKIRDEEVKKALKEKNIKFDSLKDFGVFVSLTFLSEKEQSFVNNLLEISYTKSFFSEIGVIRNEE